MALTLDAVKNFGKCEVSIGYDASATSIALSSSEGAKLPDPSTDGQFNLVWYNADDYPDPSDDPNKEIVRCTARSGDNLTIVRAQEGTSATTKNTSNKTYRMILTLTAKTIDDLDEFLDYFENRSSAGRMWGGGLSDNGDGTVDIAPGGGLTKDESATLSALPTSLNEGQGSKLTYVSWSLQENFSLAGVGYNLIYWDASAGAFAVQLKENFYANFDFTRDFTVGRVYYDGSTITIRLCGMNTYNFARRVQMFGEERFPVERATGMIISETGTRNIAVTAGVLWAELVNRFSTNSFDSSGTDRFTYWYNNGSWVSVATQSQIDNTNYNNFGVGLTALTTNRYGVHWVYEVHDSSVHVVYGQGDYTLSQAELATPPSTLPGIVGAYATLIGKIIIQKADSSFTSIISAFTQNFAGGSVSNHNDLSGIQGGSADNYYHLTSTQVTNFTSAYTHISNTSNPHSVTKSQVGLGSVENTALSTWAGTSNITTVGNIISGRTELASGLVSTDELLVNDGGTIKRMDISVLETYIETAIQDNFYTETEVNNLVANYLPLAGGTLTGNLVMSGADINLGDSDYINLGAGADLQLFHNGSNSRIQNNIGNLEIMVAVSNSIYLGTNNTWRWLVNSSGNFYPNANNTYTLGLDTLRPSITYLKDTRIKDGGVSGILFEQDESDVNSSARLMFQNDTNTFAIMNSNDELSFRYGATYGSSSGTNGFKLNASGNVVFDGNIYFGDNKHIYVGAGNDIDIYHNASNSFILSNTGYLDIGSVNSAELHFRTGDSWRWTIGSSGILYPSLDSTYDFGTTSYRVKTGYFDSVDSDAFYPNPSGIVRNGLGNADLLELAIEKGYLTNQTMFNEPTVEYTTDGGSNWNPHPLGSGHINIKNLSLGRYGATSVDIYSPSNGDWDAMRITYTCVGYRSLNYLYGYISAQGHTMTCKIEKSVGTSSSSWTEVTTTSAFGGWPSHFRVPHSAIWWNPTNEAQSKYVRITFTPSWNGTYPSNNIYIYNLNWYGQYPANSQTALWYWDFDKNITTQQSITATGDISANGTSYWGGSKEIVRFSDAWLRLNPDNDFTSGTYVVGFLRVDGGFQTGANTDSGLYHDSSETTLYWKGNEIATQSWVTSQGYITEAQDNQTLSWNGSNSQLTISGTGNTVTVDYDDNEHFYVGTGNDIDIYHNGTYSYMMSSTALYIGTSTATSIFFRMNDTARWQLDTSGHFVPAVDSTYNIGTESVRPSVIYSDNVDILSLLQLRGGQGSANFTSATIQLSYNGTDDYPHFIHTRHNSASAGDNAIDFYTCDSTQNGVFPTNAVHGMTIENGKVGIATTDPSTPLHVIGNSTLAGNVYLGDTNHLYLGGGNDLDIYHGGVDSVIYNNTGNLYFGNVASSSIIFVTNNTSRWVINSSGTLSPNTDSTYDIGGSGVKPNNIYANSFVYYTALYGYLSDTEYVVRTYNSSASNAEQFSIQHSAGNVNIENLRGNINILAPTTFSENVSLGDSDILNLGTSNDLQIQHDGSHSYINHGGTGNLYIGPTSSASLYFRTNGTSRWYINSSGDFLPGANETYSIGSSSNYPLGVWTKYLGFVNENGSGIRFWDNNSAYSIYMSTYNDATYGGRLDTTSDYNMYFKIGGGTNRGFVFMNDTTPKAQIDSSGNFICTSVIITDGSGNQKWKLYYDANTDSLISEKI